MANQVDCWKGSRCGVLTPKTEATEDCGPCPECLDDRCSLDPAHGYVCPACGEMWDDEDFAEGCCDG